MPPKPKEQVKGSGAEWYNIDFDPEILKKGAVVATAKVIKGQLITIIIAKLRHEGAVAWFCPTIVRVMVI